MILFPCDVAGGPSRFTCAPEADLKEFPSVPTQSIETPSSVNPPSVLDNPIPYVHTQGPLPSERYDSESLSNLPSPENPIQANVYTATKLCQVPDEVAEDVLP